MLRAEVGHGSVAHLQAGARAGKASAAWVRPAPQLRGFKRRRAIGASWQEAPPHTERVPRATHDKERDTKRTEAEGNGAVHARPSIELLNPPLRIARPIQNTSRAPAFFQQRLMDDK
eukprot:scaffold18716_cov128-Isochrysis_galbana.AAC.2